MPFRPLFLVVLCIVAGAPAAESQGAAPDATAEKFPPDQIEYFEKHVRPLLTAKCVECHGPDTAEAGLRLDSRRGVLHGMEGVPAAVPGDPARSRLIAVVKYDGNVQMPPDGKLPDDQLAALTNWVKLGLPWPEESTTAPTTEKKDDAAWGGSMDDRIARARAEHWAFQPVRKPTPPAVADARWSQNPIDRFVAAKLVEAKLQPSPPADARTLIRRAYFDLVGLPPSPEEVEHFVSEFSRSPTLPLSRSRAEERETRRPGDGEKAYEALVDKLLASPQYGERWARHWLDLARYADTKGYAFQQERRFPFAYTYRDYVIRAFNDDKPYDQFILEQLAADKLPPQPNNQHLAAMGFITCGRQYQGQHDTLDDQIDVVTRGLLGMTASCARCHDHKFDPIPTADYYSLYGVFRSSISPGELPLLGEPTPSPEYETYKQELATFTADRDQYLSAETAKLNAELRSRVTDYFAKLVLDRDKGAKDAEYLFDAGDPRPRIITRWRSYLADAKRKTDPVFRAWRLYDAIKEGEFDAKSPGVVDAIRDLNDQGAEAINPLVAAAILKQPPTSMLEVAKLYGGLFEQVEADWTKLVDPQARKENEPAPTSLPDANAEALRKVLYAADGPTTVDVADARTLVDRKVRGELDKKQKKLDELSVTSAGAPPRAMSLVDAQPPFDPKIFIRGDAARSGAPVPRQFLNVLSTGERKPFADGSGRLDLARSIADRDNPLTARVMVNRVWMLHFGRGLVDTPSDFGVRTPPPSHPELLDYLAAEFMDEGWSVKRLHRLIVMSQTYRQASMEPGAPSAARAAADVDPENRLLWKMNRRRLEFEAMRDAMLVVAGRLDLKPFGRPVDLWQQPFTARRSVYGYIDRQDLPGVFGVFDFANPDVTIDQRPRTTVPQQALFAMNSPFVQEQARHLAARSAAVGDAGDVAARTTSLFSATFGRAPTADEVERVGKFLDALNAAPSQVAADTWQYGHGALNAESGRVESFTRFEHWTGKEWQVGAKIPDAKLGYVSLRSGGGHPGRNAQTSAIIRWTAPRGGTFAAGGLLKHPAKDGNGVAAHVVSSRAGRLGQWVAEHGEAKTEVADIALEAGDVLDFVVESRGADSFDSYNWSPSVRLVKAAAGDASPTPQTKTSWSATEEFHGPSPQPLSSWEMLAQVLLMSNEFMFVD